MKKMYIPVGFSKVKKRGEMFLGKNYANERFTYVNGSYVNERSYCRSLFLFLEKKYLFCSFLLFFIFRAFYQTNVKKEKNRDRGGTNFTDFCTKNSTGYMLVNNKNVPHVFGELPRC